jgi:hypothetical protein
MACNLILNLSLAGSIYYLSLRINASAWLALKKYNHLYGYRHSSSVNSIEVVLQMQYPRLLSNSMYVVYISIAM